MCVCVCVCVRVCVWCQRHLCHHQALLESSRGHLIHPPRRECRCAVAAVPALLVCLRSLIRLQRALKALLVCLRSLTFRGAVEALLRRNITATSRHYYGAITARLESYTPSVALFRRYSGAIQALFRRYQGTITARFQRDYATIKALLRSD